MYKISKYKDKICTSSNTGVSYNNVGNKGKCFADFVTVTKNNSMHLRFFGSLCKVHQI